MIPMIFMMSVSIGAEPAADPVKLLKVFRDEFVAIEPGTGKFPKSFKMGSDNTPAEKPVHEVTFNYSFEIAKYEVPQNLWEAVMGKNPSLWKGPRNSVEMLTHSEAVDFCKRCTKLMRKAKLIQPSQEIRLPTEAEWEYTARAGTDTAYSFGDDLGDLNEHGWHTGNAAGNDPPVGALKPNPWGLYDMHGYLWEWCVDDGSDNYDKAPADGSPYRNSKEKRKVIRGGSWKDKASSLTSRARTGAIRHGDGLLRIKGGIPGDVRDDAIGLRCVLAQVTK